MSSQFDVLKILGLGAIGLGFLLAVLAYQLLRNYQAKPNPDASTLSTIRFFMVFSVVLCVIALAAQIFDQHKKLAELQTKLDLFTNSRSGLPHLTGRINEPAGGKVVQRVIPCSGTLAGFKEADGIHIWVAVEVDGQLWPKGRQLQITDGKWTTQVFQDPPKDSPDSNFSLALIAVDEDANGRIESWLRQSQSEKKFPSLEGVAGIVSLDRIDNLRVAARQ